MPFGMITVVLVMLSFWSCGAVARDLSHTPPQVLAFYYAWYTKTPNWVPRSRWTPSDGIYDSNDQATVDRQVAIAKAAGITGFITDWWPRRGTYTDAQFPVLLAAAARGGLNVSAVIDEFGTQHNKPVKPAVAIDDLDYVLSHYGAHPAYLKIGGKPVVFIYVRAMMQLGSKAAAQAMLDGIRGKYPGVIVLADQVSNLARNPWDKADFDGLYDYEEVSFQQGRTPAQIAADLRTRYPGYLKLACKGCLTTLTVMPGYDESKLGRPSKVLLARADGATYRAMWDAALAAKPNWILITSFNEWLEATQIEPSVEFGTTALDDTARYAKRFMEAR